MKNTLKIIRPANSVKIKNKEVVVSKNHFTLVELVIVLFLLIVIGTTMTIGTTKAIRVQKFRSACEKIESLLTTAQSMAMIYQENVTLKIFPDPNQQSLTCYIETDYALNRAIYKKIRVEGVSIAFNGKNHFPGDKLELVFRNDFSFPKGTLEISAYNFSQKEGSLKKILYLPGYPQLIGVAFSESPEFSSQEIQAPYPKEILENLN